MKSVSHVPESPPHSRVIFHAAGLAGLVLPILSVSRFTEGFVPVNCLSTLPAIRAAVVAVRNDAVHVHQPTIPIQPTGNFASVVGDDEVDYYRVVSRKIRVAFRTFRRCAMLVLSQR